MRGAPQADLLPPGRALHHRERAGEIGPSELRATRRIVGVTTVVPRATATAPGIAAFTHDLRRAADARVSTGNAVRLLRDGPDTFAAMVELIAGARTSVALESYIVRADAVGREIAAALRAAARRGVAVRLLTDATGARGLARAFVAELEAAGVEVRHFNPPSVGRRWLGLLPRDHRKLLVVDGVAGVIGGVGIGDEWRPMRSRGSTTQWRDTSVRIAGPAGADMSLAFEDMWRRTRAPAHRVAAAGAVDGAGVPATDDGDVTRPGSAVVGIVEGAPWRFRLARAFHPHVVAATRQIWIADGYFMPSPVEVEAVLGAARDGVDVRLLVPSRNDHRWMLFITRRYYRRLLAGGVRIWEWQGPMMHAKTTVVDAHVTRVGSTDVNPLGMAINYELDAVVEDAVLGAAAAAMFLDDLARSREITSSRGA